MSETQGRKEVAESVLTAVLTTIATALAQWAIDTWKERAKARKGDSDDDKS